MALNSEKRILPPPAVMTTLSAEVARTFDFKDHEGLSHFWGFLSPVSSSEKPAPISSPSVYFHNWQPPTALPASPWSQEERGRPLRRRDSNTSLLSERLTDANRYHAQQATSRAASPASRNQSPFRPESPFYDHQEHSLSPYTSGSPFENVNPFEINSGRGGVASTSTTQSPSQEQFILPQYSNCSAHDTTYRKVPKLDRTMTDSYEDQLYNPNFQTFPTSSSRPAMNTTISPQNDIFTQRLLAANKVHLSASQTRGSSPVRQDSPLAPSANSLRNGFGSAFSMREGQKAENNPRALQQQLQRTSPDQHAPRTISPKDVDLEYHENKDDMYMPLFPPRQQQRLQRMSPDQCTLNTIPTRDSSPFRSGSQSVSSRREVHSPTTSKLPSAPVTANGISTSKEPASPTMYFHHWQPPYGTLPRNSPSNHPNNTVDSSEHCRKRQGSPLCEIRSQDNFRRPQEISNPPIASVETGTYTCTYLGCKCRFGSPAKLQRHKRECHRQLVSNINEEGASAAPTHQPSQAGPHKCEWVNPATGKPCNTVFSRPYDLTRHEDLIHNARKKKLRCHLCTEEKTFSRNDALTRHFRVVHPDHQDLGINRNWRGGVPSVTSDISAAQNAQPPEKNHDSLGVAEKFNSTLSFIESTNNDPTHERGKDKLTVSTTHFCPYPRCTLTSFESHENLQQHQRDLHSHEQGPAPGLEPESLALSRPQSPASSQVNDTSGPNMFSSHQTRASEKIVKCIVCHNFSGCPSKLRKHMRRHDRPYGCTFRDCPKLFGSKHDWKRHETSQHGDQEIYRCDLRVKPPCSGIIAGQSDFKRHLLVQHKLAVTSDYFNDRLKPLVWEDGHLPIWCGFCRDFVYVPCDESDTTVRFDHIADHFIKEGKRIDTWLPFDLRLMVDLQGVT